MNGSRRRIVIIGFMGSGKTSAARALARLLGVSSIDLDEAVTKAEGRDPRALIDEEGEAYFRDAETRALRLALSDDATRVMALGGGTWTLERNRDLLAEHGCLTVWLDAPFDLCWRRIEDCASDRPLARSRERASALYDERLAAYSLADFRVRVTPTTSPEEIAASIAEAARPRA